MDLRLASALLPLGLLLLIITPGTSAGPVGGAVPIRVSVEGRGLSSEATGSYSGSVVEGGVLLGALKRLQQTDPSFRFTLREDPDHGLFLESVNGVAGSGQAQSYWELLSAGAPGDPARLDAGIGCYKPKAGEHIILRLSTWSKDL
ncbi:transcobalamin-1-like [Gadus chalcogrammus]|uniref:transcobalamin-1-like n=1 Tax=Gadus chalcogrammus TaxID=1042646 RepID=UPI0024C29379|nr:transcobalamin-1-like [Gadus chalcogrammus]XP_056449447.1 transcobalamin-1-like [Gadus chalcogrammus]